MTDVATLRKATPAARAPVLGAPSLPVVLYVTVAFAAGAGLLLGRWPSASVPDIESRLVLLLRFMAAVKALMVVGAVALTHWRLHAPIARNTALGYIGSLGVMAMAPGLIWSLEHIAVGAAAFHAGLFAFLVIAWREDAMSHVFASRGARQP